MSRAKTQLAGGGVVADPAQCRACEGAGFVFTPEAESVPCGRCDGYGRCRVVERQPQTTFVAEVAGEVVETGHEIEGFLRQLILDWPDLNATHLVVWEVLGDEVARVRAILHPDRYGRTACRYL